MDAQDHNGHTPRMCGTTTRQWCDEYSPRGTTTGKMEGFNMQREDSAPTYYSTPTRQQASLACSGLDVYSQFKQGDAWANGARVFNDSEQ